ncbi:MAG: radical SAM protein [Desulfofustis sp.]|nr:radical SAM protein [Desulfofustis sp.]
MLEVSELFYSLQGESSWSGLPCVFVRLSGCNLRCSYCDARYTYEETGISRSIADIVADVAGYDFPLVDITGGEPLLQPETNTLCSTLIAQGFRVLLETNGSLPLEALPNELRIITDIKCPGSLMGDSFHLPNLDVLSARKQHNGREDEIKFVLSSVDDYCWAREFIRRHRLQECAHLLLSTVANRFPPAECAELMLGDHLPARLQLQLHTLLWPGLSRGK